MEDTALDFTIERLGECSIPSPLDGVRFVSDAQRVLYHNSLEEVKKYIDIGKELPAMEVAGARKKIFFDP